MPSGKCMHAKAWALTYQSVVAWDRWWRVSYSDAHSPWGIFCAVSSSSSKWCALLLPLCASQSLNNLAVVLTSQGKAGEALSLLQAAISACPTYAGGWSLTERQPWALSEYGSLSPVATGLVLCNAVHE